jgi:23S rRNA (uridine2552-2'-O)-methyltransferase
MKPKSGRGQRDLKVKVKTARGRKLSSTRWLERQLNDPYVQRAKREGFRGRAAFKIMELDDRFRFLVPGARVVDLGCAPGGWCQVAVPRINALGEKPGKAQGRIIGVDLQEVDPIPGAELHVLDFLEDGADEKIKAWLDGPADVVMSDMAAASSGHKQTDHLRIIALGEAAAELAFDVLAPGGTDTRTRVTKDDRAQHPDPVLGHGHGHRGRMAIAMAQAGGMGVIHRNLDEEEQARRGAPREAFRERRGAMIRSH